MTDTRSSNDIEEDETPDDAKILGELLFARRKELGWTQADVADEAWGDRERKGDYSKIENGRREGVMPSTVKDLARALKMNPKLYPIPERYLWPEARRPLRDLDTLLKNIVAQVERVERRLTGTVVVDGAAHSQKIETPRKFLLYTGVALVFLMVGIVLEINLKLTDVEEPVQPEIPTVEKSSSTSNESSEGATERREASRQAAIDRAWGVVLRRAVGNTGKSEALEFLVSQDISLEGIDLSCEAMGGKDNWDSESQRCRQPVILDDVNLSGAKMVSINLRGVSLFGWSSPLKVVHQLG